MIVKVCGMRDPRNIHEVIDAGADWIGMIFWHKSPRCVTGAIPIEDSRVRRAGVFVDESAQNIIRKVSGYRLDIIQLHGSEQPSMVRALRNGIANSTYRDIKIIKAISVSSTEDILRCHDYEGITDAFLFDTKCKSVGGSGEQFDWSMLHYYTGSTPFILSGGIDPHDAQRVTGFCHPKMIGIDINSRFETAPAMKDAEAIRHFIEQIRQRI